MARAHGSYPWCPRFESRCRYQIKAQPFDCAFLWPVGQVVKTPPFHGGNMGSSPVRVTNDTASQAGRRNLYPLIPGSHKRTCRRMTNSAAGLFSWLAGNSSSLSVEKLLFLAIAKLTLSQKQDPMWIIFCSQLSMRFEFRKDGFSSGRFPASSKVYSD